MGAVDKTDMLLSVAESVRKTIKWYKKVFFFHLLDLSKYFWGENVQKKVRSTLFKPDQYKVNSGDFASYFSAQVEKESNLDNPLREPKIVFSVLEHFPRQVQWVMIQSEPFNIKLALLKLQELDSMNMNLKIPESKTTPTTPQNQNQLFSTYNQNFNKNVKAHQVYTESDNEQNGNPPSVNQEQELREEYFYV